VHEEQELLVQEVQASPPPATTFPSLWAKNRESAREVCFPPHFWQAIGSSAWAMLRKVSKRVLQS
jgi:hypothetical protein